MRNIMRIIARIFGALVALLLLAVCSVAAWLYFYQSDLPDLSSLNAFTPRTVNEARYSVCGETLTTVALPSSELNGKMRAAMMAAEGDWTAGVWTRQIASLLNPGRQYHGAAYSMQIARDLFCARHVKWRPVKEIRTAIQLERRFTSDELLTIYLNRIYMGHQIRGVESAAWYYFHKHAKDLDTSEAALLAGLIAGPSRFSPVEHHDGALKRRNEVIDEMLRSNVVTLEDAEQAKNSPLNLAVNKT